MRHGGSAPKEEAKAAPVVEEPAQAGPCPPAGICRMADINCQSPDTTPGPCATRTRCLECGEGL